MRSNAELLDAIAESEGFKNWGAFFDARQFALLDSVVPAICIECGFVTEMEGDQEEGACENCDSNAVKSCLILAELI